MSKYYKKYDSNLIEVFCAVVENDNNITKAADNLRLSKSAISLKIKSLEEHLGYNLFDRLTGKMILNAKGQLFYTEKAKKLMDSFYEIKNKQTTPFAKIKKYSKIKNIAENIRIFLINKWNKMLVKITLKRVFFTTLAVCICIYSYLSYTNYFFDRELEKLANPLLREVIKDGHYRVSEEKNCSFDGWQINIDGYEISKNILNRYKSSKIISIAINEYPLTTLRFSTNEAIDQKLKNGIICNVDERYNGFKKMSILNHDILDANLNFYSYVLFKNRGGLKCTNCEYFFENIKKYPDKITALQIKGDLKLNYGRYWIISYKRYYYLLSISNLIQGDLKVREINILWKKLTLDQLMHYDNGSYWKLIKDYNIKID